MVIQSRKRIANTLRALLPELRTLESQISQTSISDRELVVQIVDEWAEFRSRLFQLFPETLSFVIFSKLNLEVSESEIQLLPTKKSMRDLFIKDYKNDMKLLKKFRNDAKFGSDEKRNDVLRQIRGKIKWWLDRFEYEWIPVLDPPVVSDEEPIQLIPEEMLIQLPPEIQTDVDKAQAAFRCCQFLRHQGHQPIFEACAMYLRKALATAIILRFKQDSKENCLYDEEGRMFGLKKLLGLAKDAKFLSSNLYKELKGIKWLGDIGVHDYKVTIQESDIKPAFKLIRFALEHLFTKPK